MLVLSLVFCATASSALKIGKIKKSPTANDLLGRLRASFKDGKGALEEVTDGFSEVDALSEIVQLSKSSDDAEDGGHVYDAVADLVDRSMPDDKIRALADDAVAVYERVLSGADDLATTLRDLFVEDSPALAGNRWHAVMVETEKDVLGDQAGADLEGLFTGLLQAVSSGEFNVVEYYKTASALIKSPEMQQEAIKIFRPESDAGEEAGLRRRLASCDKKCKKWGPFADVSSRWCWCKCGNAGDAGDSCSSFCPCKSANYCQQGSHKCVRRRGLHEACGARYPCTKDLECATGMALHNGLCCTPDYESYTAKYGGQCTYENEKCTTSGCKDRN